MRKYLYPLALLALAACEGSDTEMPAPKIYFAGNGVYEMALGDTIVLSPRITYDYGSSYQWTVDGAEVSSDLEYSFVPQRLADYDIRFSVSNSRGTDAYGISVSVVKAVDCSEFDDFVPPRTPSLVLTPPAGRWFSHDGVSFSNVINPDTTMWGGFAFSNRTSVVSQPTTAAIGCAYMVSQPKNASYLVFSGYSDAYIDFGGQFTPRSIDVANDNFAYLVSKFGYTAPDTSLVVPYSTYGDFVRLRIAGLDAGGSEVAEVTQSLIDCNFDNQAKFERLSSWLTVDLRPLGKVYGLALYIECSQEGFPPFACIDNLKLQE